MTLEIGDCVHIITRRVFEKDVRRHYVGKVLSAEGSLVRMEG